MKKHIESLLGLLMLATTYNLIFLPNEIVLGGEEGLATVLKFIINPEVTILIVNISVLVISFFILGFKTTKDYILGSIFFPIFVYLTKDVSQIIDLSNIEIILKIVIFSSINGLGMGLVLRNGFSTGGTDVIANIISKKNTKQVGKVLFAIESVIVLLGLVQFGFEKTIYAIIALIIFTKVTDKVIVGIFKKQLLYIYTDRLEEVRGYINNKLFKTFSIIESKPEDIIMFSVNYLEISKIRKELNIIDPKIRIFVTSTLEG